MLYIVKTQSDSRYIVAVSSWHCVNYLLISLLLNGTLFSIENDYGI